MAVHLSCRNAPSAPSPSPSDDDSHQSNPPIPNASSSPSRSQASSSPVRRSARLHHTSSPSNVVPTPAPSSMLKPSSSPNNDMSLSNPRKRTRSECSIPPRKLEALRASTASPSPSPTRKSARLSTQAPPTPSPTPRVKRQKVFPPAHSSHSSLADYGRGSTVADSSPSPDYKSKSADASRRKRKENTSVHKFTSPHAASLHSRHMKTMKSLSTDKGKEKEVGQIPLSPPETPTPVRRSLRNREVLISSPAPTPLSAHSKSKPTPSSKGKGAPQNPLALSPTFVGQAPHIPSPLSPHGSLSSLNGLDNVGTPPSSPTRASVDIELDLVDMGIPTLSLPSPLSTSVLADHKPSSSALSSPLSSPPQSPRVAPLPSPTQGPSSEAATASSQTTTSEVSKSSSIPATSSPSAPSTGAQTTTLDTPSSAAQPTPPSLPSSFTPATATPSIHASAASGSESGESSARTEVGQRADVTSVNNVESQSMPTFSNASMSDRGLSTFQGQQQMQGFDNPQDIQFIPVDQGNEQPQQNLDMQGVQFAPVDDEQRQNLYPDQQQQFAPPPFHQPQFSQDENGQYQMPLQPPQFGQDQEQFQAPANYSLPPPPVAVQVPIQDVYIPQQVWWEQPPDVSKEPLWKGACKIRVWDIRRRYTPETIRSVVAQEAHDYFSEHGFPLGYGSPSPPSSRGHSLAREDNQRSADGFMDEEYYDWELREDEDVDMDEDEEDDMEEEEEIEREVEEEKRRQQMLSLATVKRPSGLRQEIAVSDEKYSDPEEVEEGDEDAEGEMEVDVDIAPYEDPSFNPELSSPTSPSAPPSPLSPGETLLSSFYVPVSPAPSIPSSPSPFTQSPLPQPPLQIQIPPAPILPLPPPPLASVRVYALRSLELGTKITGRGTPIDKSRTAEWARIWRLKVDRKLEERRANALAYLYDVQQSEEKGKDMGNSGRTEVQDGVKLHLPTNEEMRMDQQRGPGSLSSDPHLDAELKPPPSSPFHEWGELFADYSPEQESGQGGQPGQVIPTDEYLRQTHSGSQSMNVDRSSVSSNTNTEQERFLTPSQSPSPSEPMMNMGMNMFNIFGNMSWYRGDLPMDMDNVSNPSAGSTVSGGSLSIDGYSPVDTAAGGTSTLSFALG